MKTRTYLLVIMVAFCLSLGACMNTGDAAIKWKDPVAEAAFREWLQKPDGEIFPAELDDVTQITVSGYKFFINERPIASIRELPNGGYAYYPGGGSRTAIGANPSEITTLADFSNCRNLESLDLRSTAFSSLESIEELASLEKLIDFHIAGNANLRDISGLSALSHLVVLSLCSIEPDSFEELANILSLESLTLIDTSIENFELVGNLESLVILYVENVPASDLSPLAKLQNLRGLYYKSNAPSTDLSPLKTLQNLEFFYYESGDGIVIDSLDAIR